MNPASQTTARVVQPDVQSPLQTHLEEVSSRYDRFRAGIKTRFTNFFSRHVPYGYEDETGFHYGPLPKDSDAP